MTRDPSTETWRQALAHTTVTNSWDTASTSAQLRQTQRDLAASQADLTRAKQELAEARARIEEEREHCAWRDLAVTAMQERDLARAQLDDAIAEFTTTRTWAVADKTTFQCASCDRPIVRSQAYQPLADAKGYFSHVFCEIEEPS